VVVPSAAGGLVSVGEERRGGRASILLGRRWRWFVVDAGGGGENDCAVCNDTEAAAAAHR